ncbi:hypothetical protein KC19_9G182400, partial [Ceratodon purpureus]
MLMNYLELHQAQTPELRATCTTLIEHASSNQPSDNNARLIPTQTPTTEKLRRKDKVQTPTCLASSSRPDNSRDLWNLQPSLRVPVTHPSYLDWSCRYPPGRASSASNLAACVAILELGHSLCSLPGRLVLPFVLLR